MNNLELYKDVFCILDDCDKYQALEKIISSCTIFSSLPENREEFCASVLKREREQSTDIGHGVAIAHGKVDGLEKTRIALGFSKKGILFKENGMPVHLIFVIASPLNDNANYLKSLSALLSWVHDPEFRSKLEELHSCTEEECFFKMLKNQQFFIK